MADFRPSSYRCHVYELWERGPSIHGGYFGSSKGSGYRRHVSPVPVASRQDRPTEGKPDGPRRCVSTDVPQILVVARPGDRWAKANPTMCAAGVRTGRLTAPRRVMIRLLGVYFPRLIT